MSGSGVYSTVEDKNRRISGLALKRTSRSEREREKEKERERTNAREYITAGSRQVPDQYAEFLEKRVQVDNESQVHEGGQEYKAVALETGSAGKGNLKRRRRTNEQFSYSADSVTTGVRY